MIPLKDKEKSRIEVVVNSTGNSARKAINWINWPQTSLSSSPSSTSDDISISEVSFSDKSHDESSWLIIKWNSGLRWRDLKFILYVSSFFVFVVDNLFRAFEWRNLSIEKLRSKNAADVGKLKNLRAIKKSLGYLKCRVLQ